MTMKAPKHTAFLDLEESLAARLRQSWSRYWSALSADILHLTAQSKFDEAHKLADTLDLAPLFDKARPYARTLGMSALLLGASRITPGIRDSRMAKTPPKRHLDGYLDQLQTMLARNATEALRLMVHEWITAEEQKLVKFDPDQPRDERGRWVDWLRPFERTETIHAKDGTKLKVKWSQQYTPPEHEDGEYLGGTLKVYVDDPHAGIPTEEIARLPYGESFGQIQIGDLWVAPQWRRQGIATQLFNMVRASGVPLQHFHDEAQMSKFGRAFAASLPVPPESFESAKTRLSKSDWREEDHPRGKTTPESTPGSFAPKDGVDFWHGTVPQFFESIKLGGLQVRRDQRNHPSGLYKGPRGNAVFLTTKEEKAFDFAWSAAWEKGRINEQILTAEWDENFKLKAFDRQAVVLHFRVPKEMAEKFKTDRLAEHSRYFEGTIPIQYLVGYKVRTYRMDGEVLNEEEHTLAKSDLVDLYAVVLLAPTKKLAKADADRNQVKIMTAGKQYFALAASVQVSRLSAFGFLAEAAERGVKNYRVDAVLDEKTCEVCRHMDGWVFPVDTGLALATQIMETDDPDALKSIAPFYAQNKASLAALATYGTEDFIEEGMSLPPYHPLCRCILTPTEETADVHPADRSDRIALASQALYGEGDGVRLTQSLFGVERLPEEADTVAAPEAEEDSRLMDMLTGLLREPPAPEESGFAASVMGRLLAPEVQPAALVQPQAFEGTTIPSKWVAPFDPKRLAGLASSRWPWLAALLGWLALREPKQQSGFDQYMAEMEEDEDYR